MSLIDELLAPWADAMEAALPGLERFDAHTHVGVNDPDGYTQTFDELVALLSASGTSGCFVFPFCEPDGYPGPNDAVREAALAFSASSPDGPSLVPFSRVDPRDGAVAEARRGLSLGARGIKLHPRAERFGLDHPAVAEVFAVAEEHGVPVLVHSGRGIEAPGRHLVALARRFPASRVILAHAGATDLSWLWREAASVPNLLFDSSWFIPADLRALFSLVPPGQILFASDAPYGHPLVGAVCQVRIALEAGLSEEAIRLIFAGQSRRLAAGEPLAFCGPAVGERETAPHLLLDRVGEFIFLAIMLWLRGGDGAEWLTLARQACVVPDSIDDAPVFAAIAGLLDGWAALRAAAPKSPAHLGLLLLAGCVARTPNVALPALG